MKPKIKTTCTKLQLQLLSFCLLCLSGKTRCDGNGPAVVIVEQDSDAVLPCSLSSKENIESYLFDWKKAAQIDGGQKEVFFYDAGVTYDSGRAGQSEEFKGRVSHFPEELKHGDASIIIRNTMVADSGDYTCHFPNLQPPQTFHIKLVVEQVVVKVKQDQDALLPCSLRTKENIEQGYFDWNKLAQNDEKQKEVFLYLNGKHSPNFGSQDEDFKGRVSHFPQELEHGNASIIIRNTKKADSGNYTCTFTEPRQTFHIELVVGTCPMPNLKILGSTKDGMLLQCVVRGASSKPKVEWKDSSGNKLPAEEPQVTDRGGSYDIILQTTVTKTDNYSCVSTQEDICHQISAYTYVPVNEPVRVKVEEDGDALLPCSLSTKENIEQGYFTWDKVAQNNEKQKEVFLYDKGKHSPSFGSQDDGFKGRVSHFQQELKHGNASIIIRNMTVTDSGDYTCTFTEPRQTFHIKLVVDPVLKDRSDENIPGAAKKPFITALEETKDWSRLQCEVRGASPKPKVEWKDSSGNILPAEKTQDTDRGGSYDIILQTTVTKTDYYHCVVTQGESNHQIEAKIHVYISGPTVISVYKGDAAPLPCSLSTKKNIESEMFEWKKDGQKEVFLYDAGTINGRSGQSEEFKGRVFHFPNNLKHGDASITIRNTELTDSGNYTCDFPRLQPRPTFHIELVVETGNSGSGVNSSDSTGLIVGIVVLAVIVIILAAVVFKRHIPLKPNKGSPADHKEGSAVPLKSQPSRSQEAPDPET